MVKVSLIEDDKHYREGLVTLINNSDYFTVHHAYASGAEAIPHIIHHPPDIAIIDIKLPGKSGVDIISVIKQQIPDVLCMVCSFYDDNEFVFDALKNGASGYILKDTMPLEIIESLKELHSGGSPMSRYIARKVIQAFQQSPGKTRLSELTDRENEVLQLVATGISIQDVADKMSLSKHTITQHLKKTYAKLHVNNKMEAVNKLNNPGVN